VLLQPLHTTVAAPSVLPDTAACAPFASVTSIEGSEVVEVAVAVAVAEPEGSSPLAAGVLVVDAVSSMGVGRPTDCASFTTSLVTCSAITVSGTVEAKDSLSEACSASEKETGVVGVDSCVTGPAECRSTMCPR
jgi:hypothetical protein